MIWDERHKSMVALLKSYKQDLSYREVLVGLIDGLAKDIEVVRVEDDDETIEGEAMHAVQYNKVSRSGSTISDQTQRIAMTMDDPTKEMRAARARYRGKLREVETRIRCIEGAMLVLCEYEQRLIEMYYFERKTVREITRYMCSTDSRYDGTVSRNTVIRIRDDAVDKMADVIEQCDITGEVLRVTK